jgi:hypothetical protein
MPSTDVLSLITWSAPGSRGRCRTHAVAVGHPILDLTVRIVPGSQGPRGLVGVPTLDAGYCRRVAGLDAHSWYPALVVASTAAAQHACLRDRLIRVVCICASITDRRKKGQNDD